MRRDVEVQHSILRSQHLGIVASVDHTSLMTGRRGKRRTIGTSGAQASDIRESLLRGSSVVVLQECT